MPATDAFRRVSALLLVLPVVLAACGGGSTGANPTATPSARASAAAFAFPSPTPGGPTPPRRVAVTCASRIPIHSQLALVTLRGGTGIVVRDVTDVGHPVSRCAIIGGSYLRFVNGTRSISL